MDAAFARTAWQVLEPLHAVTYFAPESREANRAMGLRGFWMGYFAARAAPLGAVSAGAVEAAFFNFHPAMVRRAIPDAWTFAPPPSVVAARTEAAATALRRLAPAVVEVAAEAAAILQRAVTAAEGAGRPLFAANRDVPVPDDPVAALWQAATALREHRGDGHVALLTAEGLDGCEVHVLFAACEGVPSAVLRDNRGWSPQEWRAAAGRLEARGVLAADSRPTAAGLALRARVETRTDELAVRPYSVLTDTDAARIPALLGPVVDQVVRSGILPFPNPMGLPDRRATGRDR